MELDEREDVMKADLFMAHVRVMLTNMRMDKVDAFKLTAKTDVRVACVLTKRINAMDENFKTIDDVIKAGLVKHIRGMARSSASFTAQPKGALKRALRLCRRRS